MASFICLKSLSSNKCWFGAVASLLVWWENTLLRLLPPLTAHFKIRLLTFALALWDSLADARLSFNSSDVGAGFLRGESWSWSWLRF